MSSAVRVFHKGKDDDFVVWGTSKEDVEKYRKDSSVPLVEVVEVYKVFTSQTSGPQGVLGEASKAQLANEFDTENADEVIAKILKTGKIEQGNNVRGHDWNSTNDSRGARE